jgi:phytoene synthase
MLLRSESAEPAHDADARLHADERFCAEMARREAKNFYWGFISLPYEQRIAIYALYDLARQVDDEADGAVPAGYDLPARLETHRARVRAAARGEYADAIAHVLARAIERYRIPEHELQALIDGCEMDFSTNRYQTWEELRRYCNGVASVVGRMCVRIFGFDDPTALQRADDLGLALQLTNILRDVREDAGMGRIYLPQEDLRRFGVTEDELLTGVRSARWDELVAFEVRRARELFAHGYLVVRYIPRRPAVCVQTMAGIYETILDKIERDPDLPLRGRAALSKTEKLRVMIGSWLHAV